MPEFAHHAEDVDGNAAVDEAARLVARARKVLANGELAMSARPLLFGETGVYPQFVAEAKGCRFVDTTGRVYIDWVVGWGSALLGFGRPEIEQAIQKAACRGGDSDDASRTRGRGGRTDRCDGSLR
jgi:glutamate-1-semialdehyde aminotransferase